jgi:WD40 repeat protein
MRAWPYTVSLLIFAISLAACGPAAAPTATPQPSLTPSPQPTLTPEPTATATAFPTPAPTLSPAALIDAAGPVCQRASSAAVSGGTLTGPMAVLLRASYDPHPAWTFYFYQLPHLASASVSDVRTVLCISETRAQTGRYTDGAYAYRLSWDVRAVSWPDGKLLAKKSFVGANPPTSKLAGGGAGFGAGPNGALQSWVYGPIAHPDYLYLGGGIDALAISPDGKYAAIGTLLGRGLVDTKRQESIPVVDLAAMKIISSLDGHKGAVNALAFSPDGKTIASGGFDAFLRLWDVASGKKLGELNLSNAVTALAFSGDGAKLAALTSSKLYLVGAASMQVTGSVEDTGGNSLSFSPDGNSLYVSKFNQTVQVVEVQTGNLGLQIPDPAEAAVPTLSIALDGSITATYNYTAPQNVNTFALSPDGARLLTYTGPVGEAGDASNPPAGLAFWEPETGKYLGTVSPARFSTRVVRFSADGSLLATSNNAEIWIWSTDTWQVIEKLSGHIGPVIDMAFTPDGRNLVSAGSDGTVRLWPLGR